jgi:hypothetical protein
MLRTSNNAWKAKVPGNALADQDVTPKIHGDVLASHFIGPEAYEDLVARRDYKNFWRRRAEAIAQQLWERTFVKG